MDYTQLLHLAGIDPRDVALCLHKPGNAFVRRQLALMLEAHPDLFELYESTHPKLQEATVRTRPIFASFLSVQVGELIFLGLYDRAVKEIMTRESVLADGAFMDMRQLVLPPDLTPEEMIASLEGRTRFTLTPRGDHSDLVGRLVVRDPGGRNYVRLAENTSLPVLELRQEAKVAPPLPSWQDLVLTTADLRLLPVAWSAALTQWRGVYLITDHDGARYVGSAAGTDNMLGRWRAHVAGVAGVTVQLAKRATASFRSSVLELVAQAMPVDEVVRLEQSWMTRLHTRTHGLNA